MSLTVIRASSLHAARSEIFPLAQLIVSRVGRRCFRALPVSGDARPYQHVPLVSDKHHSVRLGIYQPMSPDVAACGPRTGLWSSRSCLLLLLLRLSDVIDPLRMFRGNSFFDSFR